MTIFYVGCHKPTTTLLLYLGFGQVMNGARTKLNSKSTYKFKFVSVLVWIIKSQIKKYSMVVEISK